MTEEKVIESSKTKIALLMIGAVVAVLLGMWQLSLDVETIKNQIRYNSPLLVYGTGIVGVVLFSSCAVYGFKKLFDKSPGLIVNSEGILDNSSGVKAGMIRWEEIVGIKEYQLQNQKFISIEVKNPEKYINNGNIIKVMANRANMKMCGTPINISSTALKISYDELFDIIIAYYQNSRVSV